MIAAFVLVLDQVVVEVVRRLYPAWLVSAPELVAGGLLRQALGGALLFLVPKKPVPFFWLMLGGWLSNLVSYLRLGWYPDFIRLGPLTTNTADLCISIGAAVLATESLRRLREPRRP